MFINETHIDNYIDNYWFINCPKDMSNKLLRHQLHRLIHEVMMQQEDIQEEIWNNNGGTGDEVRYPKGAEIVNVSKAGKDNKKIFDIYMSLKTNPKERLLIEIMQHENFTSLYSRIKESLEIKYDYLKGLKGLRVIDMRKQNTI